MPQSFRGREASDWAPDIGFYVSLGPSSETPRNPESTTKGILLQSDIAVTGVLTHFFQQAAADLSPCSRKINLVHLTLRQGAGNRRRSGREAEDLRASRLQPFLLSPIEGERRKGGLGDPSTRSQGKHNPMSLYLGRNQFTGLVNHGVPVDPDIKRHGPV